MNKNEKAIYYERKLIAYERMLSAYWEIIAQISEEGVTSLEYFQILKGTIPAYIYFSPEVNKRKETLEPLFLELAKAKYSKGTNRMTYTQAYNKLNKAFNDLIMAMREDVENVEGAKNDSGIPETSDR